jgi:hypothetical protein
MEKSPVKGWHVLVALSLVMALAAFMVLTEEDRPKSKGLAAEIENALRQP